MSEAEIIVKMREAVEILKEKWREAVGGFAVLAFLESTQSQDHWIRKIAEAERLSDPYMPKPPKGSAA